MVKSRVVVDESRHGRGHEPMQDASVRSDAVVKDRARQAVTVATIAAVTSKATEAVSTHLPEGRRAATIA